MYDVFFLPCLLSRVETYNIMPYRDMYKTYYNVVHNIIGWENNIRPNEIYFSTYNRWRYCTIVIAVRLCVTLLYYCHPYNIIFCVQVCNIMIQSVIPHNLWPRAFLTRVPGRSHAHRVRPTPYKSSSTVSWALKSKISSLMTIVVEPLVCRCTPDVCDWIRHFRQPFSALCDRVCAADVYSFI